MAVKRKEAAKADPNAGLIKCVVRSKTWNSVRPGEPRRLFLPKEIIYVDPPPEGRKLAPCLRLHDDAAQEEVTESKPHDEPKTMAEMAHSRLARKPEGA